MDRDRIRNYHRDTVDSGAGNHFKQYHAYPISTYDATEQSPAVGWRDRNDNRDVVHFDRSCPHFVRFVSVASENPETRARDTFAGRPWIRCTCLVGHHNEHIQMIQHNFELGKS